MDACSPGDVDELIVSYGEAGKRASVWSLWKLAPTDTAFEPSVSKLVHSSVESIAKYVCARICDL